MSGTWTKLLYMEEEEDEDAALAQAVATTKRTRKHRWWIYSMLKIAEYYWTWLHPCGPQMLGHKDSGSLSPFPPSPRYFLLSPSGI